MLTSWSEVSTPAELSIASVLMRHPPGEPCGVLDAAELGAARGCRPRPTTLARRSRAVDPDRVVGLVADVGVRLGWWP